MFRRAVVVGLAGALGVTLAAAVPGQAAPVRADGQVSTNARLAAAATSSHVRWGRCDQALLREFGIQCATITVPLNYAKPGGRKIHLEISRKKHTSSAKDYLGPMLVNPGGPGGSGLIMPYLQQFVPNGVGNRFDWIGFDPRGVGESTPSLHCDPSYFGYDRPNYVPDKPWLMKYWRTKTRAYARACGHAKAKRLLPFMTTRANARDMNSIRKALGVRKISYYGFSWGSYLGQNFLTLYPHRVKRVVLDGVVNPGRVWYGANLDQDRHFDSNMDVFWRWVAAHNSTFQLGTDWKAIKATFYSERRALRKHPAAGGKLGPDELTDAMLDAGYYVYGWQDDAQMFADLVNKGDGTALLDAYRSGNVGRSAENGYAVYDAVQCVDNPWPGWAKTRRDSWRIYEKAPFETWGNTWYNAPCMNWPVRASHRTYIHQKAGLPRFLLISETKDAATPYSGALAVRGRFGKARLIAGVGGTTHASSLSGVACVDDRIAHYLATGKVPARKPGRQADVLCPHVPPPTITTGSARTIDRGMPRVLREALEAAQRSSLIG